MTKPIERSALDRQRWSYLFPSFFDGSTGTEMLRHGGTDAWLLGIRLLANRYINAIGLYTCPWEGLRIPWDRIRLATAFAAIDAAGFAEYDDQAGMVWIKEYARIQFQLKTRGDKLNPTDKRVILANRLFAELPHTRLSTPFRTRYGDALLLSDTAKKTEKVINPKDKVRTFAWKGHRKGHRMGQPMS